LKWQVILDRDWYFKERFWCVETFGQSIEYHYFTRYCSELEINPVWSWDTHNDQAWKGHLYFKDDYILDMFEKHFEGTIKV